MTNPSHDDLARRLRDGYALGALPPLRDGLDPVDADGVYAVQAINAAAWLAGTLADRGQPLKAGNIMLPRAFPISDNSRRP